MSFHFTFFTESLRYITACGQLPFEDTALSSNSSCTKDSTEQLNLTWGILQSIAAFVIWVSCALIGIRSRKGSSALIPSTIALYIAVALIAHGIFTAENWKVGFYLEVGCWGGAFLFALLFFCFDLERIPLGSFVCVTLVGAGCMIAEFTDRGTISSAKLNNGDLCAIVATPLIVGGILGGFCCKKRRLRSGALYSAQQSGLDEDGVYYDQDDTEFETVRFGGKGYISLHILAGSICQAFVVAPLVFAACKFEGCPAIWQLEMCHQDSYDSALAVTVAAFAGSAVIGLIVQICWAYRSVRDAFKNEVNPELHNHFKDVDRNDLLADDRASRSILKGQSTTHLDNRWTKMAVQDGY